MVKLLWTKSNLPLSKVIRWISKEPCSHFAISFDDKFVFHSNLAGVHPTFYSWFTHGIEIVHQLEFHESLEVEEKVWQEITSKFDKPRPYDFGGFIYFVLTGIAYRFFGRPMPKKNIWSDSDCYLCTELAMVLRPFLVVPDGLDITTPESLWLMLKDNYQKGEHK